ncbi:MAG: Bacterial Ig-like domain [Rhodobacteraceae bacterium HLUCCA12]|nr:MAG: Bacterial Ig-like domain [Rhodobacteraceae bacterium HLUCCA12]
MRQVLIFVLAMLACAPAAMAQTIEIPREQIEALPDIPDLPVPELRPDLSSPEGLFRAIEDISRTDWIDTLPEAVFERMRGLTPFEAHVPVVWEMQASGAWTETVSGTGSLSVTRLTAVGGSGRQVHAILDTDARNWPFQVFADLPDGGSGLWRRPFAGTGGGAGSGGTGVGAVTNHMFQPDRVLGYATPQAMRNPGVGQLNDAFLYTEVDGGMVRVDTRDDAYRLSFQARVVEYSSDGSEPTGRVASIRGWVCERAAYEQDPESCLHQPLELVEVTPESQRENVNYQTPRITLAFSDPVDLDSLRQSFVVETRNAAGEVVDIAGRIEPRDDVTYAFLPDDPLPDATRFEARLTGGPEGVRSREGEHYLDQGRDWRFSTLVDPDRGMSDDDVQIALNVYQTMRNAPLIAGKPALLRLTPQWTHRDEIHPDWQVHDFPATVEATVEPVRLLGQHGRTPDADGVLRIYHDDSFAAEDRRLAVDTVNLFGWMPEWSGAERLISARVTPFDPWPEPLESTEFEGEDRFRNWGVEPRTLRVRYAFLEAGSWAGGVPDEVRAHTRSTVADAQVLATQLFPVRATAMAPIHIPGVEGTIDRAFLFTDYDDTTVSTSDLVFHNGLWDLNEALGSNVFWESDARAVNVVRRAAARLRWLMDLHRTPADAILILYPFEVAEIGRATGVGDFFSLHQQDRGIGMAIDPGVDADTLAMGIVHELGHALGLNHNPGDLSQLGARHPASHDDPTIEGFRLALDGSTGWNKSAAHGNAEADGILAPLMWPSVTPTGWIWLNQAEYGQLMGAFGGAPGSRRFGFLDDGPVRLASAGGPDPATIARLIAGDRPPPERLAVLGALHPQGADARIDHVSRTPLSHQGPSSGDFTAELRDDAGAVLSAVRFQPAPPPALAEDGHHDLTPQGNAPRLATPDATASDPDDPAWWQDFALTLPYHPAARDLIVRRGDTVLASLAAPETAPRAEPQSQVLDLRAGPARLDWALHGDRPRVDLQYSPDAESDWQFLLLDQIATGARIDPAELPVGPAPSLRLTVRDGIAQRSRIIPVLLDRPPEPVSLSDAPLIGARFDRAIPAESLAHVSLLGTDGAPIRHRAALSPDGRHLSLWPQDPQSDPDEALTVRLGPAFGDRFGNRLDRAFEWSVTPP